MDEMEYQKKHAPAMYFTIKKFREEISEVCIEIEDMFNFYSENGNEEAKEAVDKILNELVKIEAKMSAIESAVIDPYNATEEEVKGTGLDLKILYQLLIRDLQNDLKKRKKEKTK